MTAWNRFVEFAWHPSIAWQRMPQPKHRPYRFPAPGSISQKEYKYDYKTSYKDSIHDVRNSKQDIHFKNNQVKMSMGKSLGDKSPRVDDLGMLGQEIKGEAMEEVVRALFAEVKERNDYENCVFDLQEMYYPQFLLPKSYDMCADDPVLRQMKLDLDAYIDLYSEINVAKGKMEVMVGDPDQWQILDNSFAPENIKLLQGSVKDYVSNTNLQTLEKVHNTDTGHPKTYLHFPIQSKFVE